jgi:DNA repair protein RadC
VVGPELVAESQEVFILIALDIHGKMICPPYEIARGQRDRVTVGIDNVMDAASDARCAGFIVAHPHPGGTARPSKADIALTKEIKASTPKGRVFIDHVVVTPGCAYSIVESRAYKIKT